MIRLSLLLDSPTLHSSSDSLPKLLKRFKALAYHQIFKSSLNCLQVFQSFQKDTHDASHLCVRSRHPLIVLFHPLSLHAQVTGTISGYVQDQGGGVLPGATVTAESAGQQLVRSTQTNETGFFDLQALPRGTYQIKVEMAGFETQVQRTSRSPPARTCGWTFRSASAARRGGRRGGRATMLETRSATQSNLIDDQRVQDLPMNGRNVVALAGTYAGVTSIRASQDTSDGRQGPIMSVNGGNTNHNLFTLNGSCSRTSTRRPASIRRRPTRSRRSGFRPTTSRPSTATPPAAR